MLKEENHMKNINKLVWISLLSSIGLCAIATGSVLAVNDEPLADGWAPSEWDPMTRLALLIERRQPWC